MHQQIYQFTLIFPMRYQYRNSVHPAIHIVRFGYSIEMAEAIFCFRHAKRCLEMPSGCDFTGCQVDEGGLQRLQSLTKVSENVGMKFSFNCLKFNLEIIQKHGRRVLSENNN